MKGKILKITPQQARIIGLNPETLKQIKKRIVNGVNVNLRTKTIEKLQIALLNECF